MEPTGSTRSQPEILDKSLETPSNSQPFSVVGIGASAGGLEALEAFFAHMPADSGLAFVVVQHLSPDFRSLMDEILARQTQMPIYRVENGMAIEPNAIYLIPPKKEMIISGRKLLLTDKDPTQGLTLPIDIFFRSLAQDLGPLAIGVVLSGTGSDGSRGIRAIHEGNGLVLAQTEETARFDGMPRSAIDTGVVDLILPPASMPPAILRHIHRDQEGDTAETTSLIPADLDGINAIFRILREEYGIDFSNYKPNTVARRVERRLHLSHAATVEEYAGRLHHDLGELNALYKDLLIGVTKFFRDTEAFERLGKEIIPPLIARLSGKDELRVWVAGCATGEEAYSVAILIQEHLNTIGKNIPVKLFATDAHRASLDVASTGIYSEASLSEVSQAHLDHYFTKQPTGYQVSPDLRKMIVFAPHNVIKDAPFTKLDLITCRNLLIYLQPMTQKKVLSLFHFGLKAGGILFLGPSESPGELADEFEPLDNHWKIYRKRRDIRLPPDLRLPLSPGYSALKAPPVHVTSSTPALPDIQLVRSYDVLLNEFVPPSFLINERRELVHVFADAGTYLLPRSGRPSFDILDMVDKDLRMAMAGAIQRAQKELTPVVYSGVRFTTADGARHECKLTVKPLVNRDGIAPHILILLENPVPRQEVSNQTADLDMGQVSHERLHSLEAELRYTKENLQAAIEELETSNEELQATNEELVASNEELQSTNEELHSVNEELYTVNAEHQRKIVELTELTDDMDNLFRSTDVGTIFLDRELCIRRFTPKILQCFHILPQDIGRRIDSFSHTLLLDNLLEEVGMVLEKDERIEHEIQDRHGNWFLLRILPYYRKTIISGVVLSLIDVSLLKQTEKELRRMSKVFMDAADPIIIEDLSGHVVDLNAAAERTYGWSRDELVGESILKLIPPEHHAQALELRRHFRESEPIQNVEQVRLHKSGRRIPILLTLSMLSDEVGVPGSLAAIAKDITDLKNAEEENRRYAAQLEHANAALRTEAAIREQAEEEARAAVRLRDEFLAMLSHELRNPLGAILNATQVMDRASADPATLRDAADVIRRQSKQMARLLDDLLDVARITQGKIEIRRECIDLRELVHDALQAVKPYLDSGAHRLTVEVDEHPLPVEGDPSRILQIQENLLINAAKYTPRGGEINLLLRRDGDEALLQVRDNGMGIPSEMLHKIFDLFVQSDHSLDRPSGGMGLGLTLVRKLVLLHGGTVTAESPGPGQGSTFTVRFPLVSQLPTTSPPHKSCGNHPSQLRVLLVEDNPDSRKMLQTMLQLDGYQVESATSGVEGLEAIRAGEFDVALIDIGLPGMDGYTLARQVREMETTHRTYLLALTGYGRSRDRQAVLEAGFDAHLVKPLRPEQLYRILENLHK